MAQDRQEAGLVLGCFLRRLRRVPQLALQPFPAQDFFGQRQVLLGKLGGAPFDAVFQRCIELRELVVLVTDGQQRLPQAQHHLAKRLRQHTGFGQRGNRHRRRQAISRSIASGGHQMINVTRDPAQHPEAEHQRGCQRGEDDEEHADRVLHDRRGEIAARDGDHDVPVNAVDAADMPRGNVNRLAGRGDQIDVGRCRPASAGHPPPLGCRPHQLELAVAGRDPLLHAIFVAERLLRRR